MPWQFSLVRTGDELILTQARGPSEKFDPVLKRFAIEERSLGDDPIEAHHSVIRRVWREDSTRPHVRSQRSEGHIIELLYRDPTGRHLARPDQREDTATTPDDSEYHPTDHPGVYVSTTFIRSEDGADMKYTEERDYRITAELLEQYAEVYLLSYYEVNEESVDRATWKTEEAVAYRLVR
jgi:hypothetical protein